MRILALTVVFSFQAASAADLPLNVTLAWPPGPYTVQRWKGDWPGCEFEGGIAQGRVTVVDSDAFKWLRVNFAVGQIGPEQGGAGWRMPFGKHEAADLTYNLRFSQDFDFVKGGKLPGLCGGPDNVSGGRRANGTNGFSARLMWRKDGRGEAYVYHKNQKGDYGDSFAFPADFRFPTGTKVKVRIAVTMNAPGKRDGTLRVWIDEKAVVERTDMEWRTVGSFGVDGLYFETFHGGGDASWAPTRACWAEFAEMKVTGQ
ncbi:polysaccharide lyase [Prosthecobacter sp.]|uniref:polysaccharide lyase n=1 Tax=Prosthecobacter sp. TaxID=1965333 RepID=UPI0037839570